MTRAQQGLSVALLVTSLYLVLYLGLIPLNQVVQDEIIPVLPGYSLVVLGSYVLFRLGWGVFTFNDVPDAHDSLQDDIVTAKAELSKMKVDVD